MKLYMVGGCVRDELLGRKSNDIDLAVEAESYEAMRQGVLNMGGEIFPVENAEKYLTIRAKTPEFGATDFVLCRKDGEYKDGRRPENVEMGTIFDDLARRDFTMNAIARDVETGGLIDPFNGQKDIEEKLVRCVRSPMARFGEDALRVFRAIRFAVTLGFSLDAQIGVAIKSGDINYDGVSTERIREELNKMFMVDTRQSYTWLNSLGLLDLVFERGFWFQPTTKGLDKRRKLRKLRA